MALGIAYFTLMAVGQFTIGQWIVSGRASVGLAFKEPIVYAVAAAIVFMGFAARPPLVDCQCGRSVGRGVDSPVAAVVGCGPGPVHGEIRAAGVDRQRGPVGARFAIGYGVAELFGLDGLARDVLILQSATPAAVFNYLFAERYDQAPEEVAGTIIVSTVIFFLVLPGLLAFLL